MSRNSLKCDENFLKSWSSNVMDHFWHLEISNSLIFWTKCFLCFWKKNYLRFNHLVSRDQFALFFIENKKILCNYSYESEKKILKFYLLIFIVCINNSSKEKNTQVVNCDKFVWIINNFSLTKQKNINLWLVFREFVKKSTTKKFTQKNLWRANKL